MKAFQIIPLFLVVLSIVISACGVSVAEVATDSEPPIRTSEPEIFSRISTQPQAVIASKQPGTAGAQAIPEEVIEQAKTDLMEHLGVTAVQIAVLNATTVDWPDASLGCPQPGMAYAEVITPGYWIVLETAGNQYSYHTDLESQVILCREELLPSFPVKPGEIDDGQPWMPP